MNDIQENGTDSKPQNEPAAEPFDYTYVSSVARIAFYDDLRSAPRVTEIQPAPTADYIESLASKIYEQAKSVGGAIPYTAIREVSENFIHARFEEIIVSILDGGNTIRFADQGPGIKDKTHAQMPGFSSAIEPMKHYIRGVGSGLPIVKEYLEFSHGTISIDDNLGTGAVVTISLKPKEAQPEPAPAFEVPAEPAAASGVFAAQMAYQPQPAANARAHGVVAGSRKPSAPVPPLNQRERDVLAILLSEGACGVTPLSKFADLPMSSTHAVLKKLEEAGLVEKTPDRLRMLTEFGFEVAESL